MTACVLCRQPADGEPARYQIPVAGAMVETTHPLCKRCAAAADSSASRESYLLFRLALRDANARAGEARGTA
ncbi:MAG: hypothetical protein KJ018_11855 [Burkholderiales bacterium]|nr:hypothetical protein [Burkholderiales bacterium]